MEAIRVNSKVVLDSCVFSKQFINDIYLNIIDNICSTGHKKSGFPSFYDASYHVLAIIHDCYFITADQRHFSKTLQLGDIVLLNNWSLFYECA